MLDIIGIREVETVRLRQHRSLVWLVAAYCCRDHLVHILVHDVKLQFELALAVWLPCVGVDGPEFDPLLANLRLLLQQARTKACRLLLLCGSVCGD